jgi:hypothetical protein
MWDMKILGDFSVETSFWISEQVCRKKPTVSEWVSEWVDDDELVEFVCQNSEEKQTLG